MVEYENVIILKSNLIDNQLAGTIEKIENKIKEQAEITEKQDLGIKQLAYEVNKNKEGHYLVYKFKVNEECKQNAIQEIERFYRITDEVLKFIIIKVD